MRKLRLEMTSGSLQINLLLQAELCLGSEQLFRAFFFLDRENLQEDCTTLGILMHCLTVLMAKKLFTIPNTLF